jgi:uncharacterized protein (DUF58 family)
MNWRAHWRRLRARFRQRLTRAGWAYLLAVVLVAAAAFVSANNLLFLILAAMVATFMVSGFAGRMSLAGLELDLLLPPHVAARRTIRAAVRLTNLKRYVPSFSVQLAFSQNPDGMPRPALYFPVIPGGASIEEPVELYFPRRGAYTERSFEFSTRFPFGFVERREDVTIRHEVIVYPCLDPQPGFEALLARVNAALAAHRHSSAERGQGGDFYRLRPYDPAESARHVDWKSTAHTGSPQVREFTRERDLALLIFLDLNVAAGREAAFERAVECAAYLAFELAQRGASLGFRTQTWEVTSRGSEGIYSILKYLALVSPIDSKSKVIFDDQLPHIVLTTSPPQVWEPGPGRWPMRWVVDPDRL